MSDRLKALREKRGQSFKAMTDITDKAAAEKRDLTAEEVVQHGKAFEEIEGLRSQITAEERSIEVAREAAAGEIEERQRREREGKGGEAGDDKAKTEARKMEIFREGLRVGEKLSEEKRAALNAGNDTEGGYLTAPQTFVAELIKNVDDAVFMRGLSTNHQIGSAKSLGVPTLDTDVADFDWTTELGTGSEDTSARFGKREMVPHPLAKRIKISKTLLRNSIMPIDAIVRQRLAYKLGITLEKNYMTGDGNKKPLGAFTASASGVPTSRDVSTGNTTTSITFDGLINAKYSLKGAYWPKAQWLFHRDALKMIAKLKDGDGQYLWRPSVIENEPDMLLGRPLNMSEYAPNTFTSGLYVGMFADFSAYWTVDALDLQIQVLNELYAETNQDGFILRYEGDGAPVLAEAFARVTLA